MENYLDVVGNELLKEHIRVVLTAKHLPSFWKQFPAGGEHSDNCLTSIVTDALVKLAEDISQDNIMNEMSSCYPSILVSRVKWDQNTVDEQFVRVLSAFIPNHVFPSMKRIVHEILEEHQNVVKNQEGSMDIESVDVLSDEWHQSQKLLEMFRSKNLIKTFLVHPVAAVVKEKISAFVNEECSQVYDEPVLKDTVSKIHSLLEGWLQLFFKDITECSVQDWKLEMLHHLYYAFGKLRVSELFDIIVEFPDSLPAVHDLKECLASTNMRNYLKISLKAQFSRRLLHPGANTADILTHYISSIKALQILDPSGVVLENVCDSVRTYLRTRDDTVFCIMASLTDESCNELSEELARGQSLLLDLSEECDDENQDFDAWEPDPIDADPTKTSKSRQTSDIISILVNIYGSQDMFVSEYRHLLADRLLQTLSYDTSRELRNLELLKLRFGEASLHFCDVMLKDVADSRRTNAHIHTQLNKKAQADDTLPEMELNSFVLSHVFWPSFKGDKLKPPKEIQQKLDGYTEHFKSLKGMRTLEWCNNLGAVELELELGGQVNTFTVTPPRAILIWHFQDQDSRSVEELCTLTESQPATVRRHLSSWVSQGVLREGPSDTFTIASDSADITERIKDEMGEEEESNTVIAGNQKDSENDEMLWSYISAMLTNLGAMPLERIDTMLKMFMTEGKECSSSELKAFLDKKVKNQQIIYAGGTYQLS